MPGLSRVVRRIDCSVFLFSMRRIAVIFLIALAVASCEKEKNSLVDTNLSTPLVSSTSVVVSSINLDDTVATGHVVKLPDGTYRITDTVLTEASSPLGYSDIRTVSFRIFAPGSPQSFLTGMLTPTGEHPNSMIAKYRGVFVFVVERGDVGVYSVVIDAENAAKFSSNASVLPLQITRNNSRPQLSGLVVPDTIGRPTSGSSYFKFTVFASDSDGYRDIHQVFLRLIAPTISNIVQMYDNGDAFSGDDVAGDGTFSVIVQIDPSNTLGDKTFLFQAMDKSGALSDSLIHKITIVQGP